jgi:hypothetical protein
MAFAASPLCKTPSVVATLATSGAIADLQTLLYSLALFNDPVPTVYLYCDSATALAIKHSKYPGRILTRTALDKYSGKTRQQMEAAAGREFESEWFDFMAEKINLLEWVFSATQGCCIKGAHCLDGDEDNGTGVLFCDADICFFAPLPAVPDRVTLALSHHGIRTYDESRFGRYNGGFFWLSNPAHLAVWRRACHGSRFYEQSALEDLAAAVQAETPKKFYEFPRTQNYGWWRLWQAADGVDKAKAEWSLSRFKAPKAAGILIGGEPLGSVHTHFWETQDRATVEYNNWIKGWLQKLAAAGHQPAKKLLFWLNGPPPPSGTMIDKSKIE